MPDPKTAVVVDQKVVESQPKTPRPVDNPELVAKVQLTLDKLNSADPDHVDSPVVRSDAELAKTPAPTDEGGKKPASDDVTPKENLEADPAKPGSTLPAALRRTAKAREWSDEEIDGFFKQNPALALKTFEKMHQSRVQEVNEWAKLGRSQQKPPVPVTAIPATGAPPDPLASLVPINVDEMVKKFGNEAIIKELAGPWNTALPLLKELAQEALENRAVSKKTMQETVGNLIDGFFTSAEIAAYKDLYGDGKSLTAEQVQVRNTVLETADALIAGAAMQGRNLSVEDALNLAHDSVSGDFKEKVAVEQIRKTLTKRAKGLTLQPSHRGETPGGPPRDRNELLDRTTERMRAVFG